MLKSKLINLDKFKDQRGSLIKFYQNKLIRNFNVKESFYSFSKRNVFRGMHFQKSGKPENKIMYLLGGEIFLSIVDLREKSPTYMMNANKVLSQTSEVAIFIPAGCAAGWLSLEDNVTIQYLMSSRYEQNSYSGFAYNDPQFNIPWPYEPKIISDQDRNWQKFSAEEL